MNKPAEKILEVSGLTKTFSLENDFFSIFKSGNESQRTVKALEQVSFDVFRGETLGILGESGSGKSTLARILMGIYEPDAGSALLNGKDVFAAYKNSKARLAILKEMQLIFQDPYGSLDPRMTVRQIIAEPLKIHGLKITSETEELLKRSLSEVGLGPECLARYPSEFSGGQRQRIGICRAMILNPGLVIADEAVSALDVSVQAQILELLCRLRQERNLSMIFISHDLAVVRQISDRIILLYRGNLVEEMPADCLLNDAVHPYTLDLLGAAMFLREGREIDKVCPEKNKDEEAAGCCYVSVCGQATEKCREKPEGIEIHSGHKVFCWKALRE
ncbi:MAG: dipeptide ABC transporter ATP-binding protein [Candidatus Rifleibacteriota bacterium]